MCESSGFCKENYRKFEVRDRGLVHEEAGEARIRGDFLDIASEVALN